MMRLLALLLLCGTLSAQGTTLLFSNNGFQTSTFHFEVDLTVSGVLPVTSLDLFSPPGPFCVFWVPGPPLAAGLLTPANGLLWLDPALGPQMIYAGNATFGLTLVMTFVTSAFPPGMDLTFQAIAGGGTDLSTSLHLTT